MKRTLSVKEVAQELGASVQSIRRALARSHSIASATCCGSIWIVPSRSFWPKDCQRSYDHAARDRRRLPAARQQNAPVR